MEISVNDTFLADIKEGYQHDDFCTKLSETVPGVEFQNGLWYVVNHLVIPKWKQLRESLYWLAHNSAGHFGADKCYALLKDSYFWPGIANPSGLISLGYYQMSMVSIASPL
uniref:Integrase zinc-binding domain-containing protein n=1 Tax=Moniliophthora roreri TaxID=221103 RepID=A0A0W0FT10_MONRR